MSEPLVYEFGYATVRVWHDGRHGDDGQWHRHYLETVFRDGAKCPAVPHDTDGYRAMARELGYGDDTWAMCREHEIAHSFLMERFGWPMSMTLWAVAHGTEEHLPAELRRQEEAFVLDFQRMLNGVTARMEWSHRHYTVTVPEFRQRFRGEQRAAA